MYLFDAAAAVVKLETEGKKKVDFQVLVIDQKNDMFCRLICLFDLLWFFCDTCTRSRISLCISSHFDDNQALLAS